jgi:sugar/nucleoside kinase (ribokinase family)
MLLCFGNAALDVTLRLPSAEIAQILRSAAKDGETITSDTAGAPQEVKERVVRAMLARFEGETTTMSGVITPGGAAMNSARVAAAMSMETKISSSRPASERRRVGFLGGVARDRYGAMVRSSLALAGVEPFLFVEEADQKEERTEGHEERKDHTMLGTGVCVSLVAEEDGERTLALRRGAAELVSPSLLQRSDVAGALRDTAIM